MAVRNPSNHQAHLHARPRDDIELPLAAVSRPVVARHHCACGRLGAPAASWLPGRVSLCGTARATEPVDSFLAALRERHYYDEVFDYLKLLESNPNVGEQVRQQIPFEQAITLSASAGETQYWRRLKPCMPGRPVCSSSSWLLIPNIPWPVRPKASSPQSCSSKVAANFAQAEANGTVATVARKPANASTRHANNLSRSKEFAAKLEQMPKLISPEDHEQQRRKRQISADLGPARLLQATAEHETARSYPADSGDAKKHFGTAAASYAKLYETYRTRAAGLYARLWEGHCHQDWVKSTGRSAAFAS